MSSDTSKSEPWRINAEKIKPVSSSKGSGDSGEIFDEPKVDDFEEDEVESRKGPSKKLVICPTWRAQVFTLMGYFIVSIIIVPVTNLSPDIFVLKGRLFQVSGYQIWLYFPWLTMLPGAILFKLLYFMYNSRYIIDERGVEAQVGLVAMSLRQPRLRYEDIRGVEPKQTLLERLLGIGTLMVGSAMTFEVEIEMIGVSNPREIQHLINTERDKHLKWIRRGANGSQINTD